jgi:transcription antitermination factor NusG
LATLPPTPPLGVARLFFVGRTVSRDEALAAGPGIVAQAAHALTALFLAYRFIAWSRDNDFLSMREALQKEKQARRQKGLAKNDPVRIVRGMFAGKQGVVQEVDARGGLKVLVGKMAVKVDAEDVLKN